MSTAAAAPPEARLDVLESRAAIADLMARYATAFDRRDLDGFLSVWHPDAGWSMGPGHDASGHDAIRASAEGAWEQVAQTHHWPTNVIVDVDGDTAAATADAHAMVKAADGSWSQVGASYRDTWTRRDGRWALQRRDTDIHFQLPIAGG